jgi:hypothetical protein
MNFQLVCFHGLLCHVLFENEMSFQNVLDSFEDYYNPKFLLLLSMEEVRNKFSLSYTYMNQNFML